MSTGHISVDDILRLPPIIFGTIRWKASVGVPLGEWCQGFDILVEERTPTQFRIGPNGPEPIPGSSRWIIPSISLTCYKDADENGMHAISFQVRGVHLNFPPNGAYRITPTLKGRWSPRGLLFPGYRVIEPIAYYVSLSASSSHPHIDFDVVRRSWFGGRLLP